MAAVGRGMGPKLKVEEAEPSPTALPSWPRPLPQAREGQTSLGPQAWESWAEGRETSVLVPTPCTEAFGASLARLPGSVGCGWAIPGSGRPSQKNFSLTETL